MTWTGKSDPAVEVGKTYKVSWDDCCTVGWFISPLVEVITVDGEIDSFVFEHGAVTDGFVTLTEVDP